jgi:hypothetical protein
MHPEGVAKKNDGLATAGRDFGGDLGVATYRSREKALHFETGGDNEFSGMAGRYQMIPFQDFLIVFDERNEFGLFSVVGDEGNRRLFLERTLSHAKKLTNLSLKSQLNIVNSDDR